MIPVIKWLVTHGYKALPEPDPSFPSNHLRLREIIFVRRETGREWCGACGFFHPAPVHGPMPAQRDHDDPLGIGNVAGVCWLWPRDRGGVLRGAENMKMTSAGYTWETTYGMVSLSSVEANAMIFEVWYLNWRVPEATGLILGARGAQPELSWCECRGTVRVKG